MTERICSELDGFYQTYKHTYVPPYKEHQKLFELTEYARRHQATLPEETVACLDALQFDWKASNQDTRWYYHYYLLKQFYEEHGHTELLFHHPDDPRLGAWVHRQKKQKDRLSSEKVKLLEQLHFNWKVRKGSNQKRWEKMFEKLKAFQQEYHHVMVPSTYEDAFLAKWVIYQRKNHDQLSVDQKERLESLGFVFDMQQHKALSWEYRYQQLLLFKKKHGHTNVPKHDKNKRLYDWVRTQRMMKETLPRERVKKLVDIGFEFSDTKQTQRDKQWLENYRKVEQFYKKHGHLHLPDRKLYQWLYKQKLRWPKDEHRQSLLKQLGLGEGRA